VRNDFVMEFRNRRDAGRRLAAQLLPLAHQDPVVVALPRGGVPVAFEVACSLGAPLDILAVRKLGAPANPEFAVGALAEDGTSVLDAETVRRVGMTQSALELTLERELREVRRRAEEYRAGTRRVDVRGRTVLVVDDGLATGLSCLVAVRALCSRGAARVVVAVPVAAPASIALLGAEADEVVSHMVPREFVGVGRWYHDFAAVSDGEVLALLRAAGERHDSQRTGESERSGPHDADGRPHAAPRARRTTAPHETGSPDRES
jgi:putative phosphoribosyl transferase